MESYFDMKRRHKVQIVQFLKTYALTERDLDAVVVPIGSLMRQNLIPITDGYFIRVRDVSKYQIMKLKQAIEEKREMNNPQFVYQMVVNKLNHYKGAFGGTYEEALYICGVTEQDITSYQVKAAVEKAVSYVTRRVC